MFLRNTSKLLPLLRGRTLKQESCSPVLSAGTRFPEIGCCFMEPDVRGCNGGMEQATAVALLHVPYL